MKISWTAMMYNSSDDEANAATVEVEIQEVHAVINVTKKENESMSLFFRISSLK
jgi:hypothetical protein